MSRCFPYPPPGYARNGVPGEALIESIKIQTGKEKSKSDRSKEKREKKEKRKEKKQKEQLGIPGKVVDCKVSGLIGEKSQCPEKLVKKEKRKRDEQQGLVDEKSRVGKKLKEDPFVVKMKEVETEQLEKSGLTEEHEQPVNLQTPCYLSDSTRSSHKRRRQNSPPSSGHASPSSCSRTHGNVLRIKLPVQKQREPDSLLSKDRNQQCSTSGRVHSAAQLNVPKQELSKNLKTSIDLKKVTPKPIEHIPKSVPKLTTTLKDQVVARVAPKLVEQIPKSTTTLKNKVVAQVEQIPKSTTLKNKVAAPIEQIIKSTTTLKNEVVAPVQQIPKSTTTFKNEVVAKPDSDAAASKTSKPRKDHKDEKRWAKLCSKMEAFVPLSLQIEQGECDDDWLFGTKPKEQVVSKRCRVDDCVVGSANYPLWPRAQLLAEADIYALPYTFPF